jgi:hypothetical protein
LKIAPRIHQGRDKLARGNALALANGHLGHDTRERRLQHGVLERFLGRV